MLQLITATMSSIKIRKGSGPKFEPWCTPDVAYKVIRFHAQDFDISVTVIKVGC